MYDCSTHFYPIPDLLRSSLSLSTYILKINMEKKHHLDVHRLLLEIYLTVDPHLHPLIDVDAVLQYYL